MEKKSDIQQLMSYAGKHKIFTYMSWCLSAVSSLIALVPFMYIWKIISEALRVMPNYEQAENLTRYGWMAVLFASIALLVYVGGLMCSHVSAFRVATNIRIKLMKHITTLPIGFMDTYGSGRMRAIVNESSAATETYLAHQLPDRYGAIATPIGLIVLLIVFDWRLGLLSLLPVAIGFVLMSLMTGKKMQESMTYYQNSLETMSNEAVEYVRGIPVVKTFGQTVFSFKRFKQAIDDYFKFVITYTNQCRWPMIGYLAATNSVFAFLIAGAVFFTQGEIQPEFVTNLLFYIIITPVISISLTKIMYQSENKMVVADALERINSVLAIEPLADNKNNATTIKNHTVTLTNVIFSYDGKSNAVDGVSLEIPQGSTVAFVGPSGGGKTTVANLIARFFDVKSGRISIGGINIKDIPKKQLMNTVSFVFQDSKLLKTSILENVRLGKPNATKEEVLRAIDAAQCTDIIEKFPQGLDTIIGSKGVYLSGGEIQRLAIARAILKNAPIIILDEATAFADPDNEVKVQKALSSLAQGKTVIMIAHRLSTIAKVDKIFVLKDGKVLESGTHTELADKSSLYSTMWQSYNEAVQWKVEKGGATA